MGVGFEPTIPYGIPVFETSAVRPLGYPTMFTKIGSSASPAGLEPTLRDPQSRGLSISLRGQQRYFTKSKGY